MKLPEEDIRKRVEFDGWSFEEQPRRGIHSDPSEENFFKNAVRAEPLVREAVQNVFDAKAENAPCARLHIRLTTLGKDALDVLFPHGQRDHWTDAGVKPPEHAADGSAECIVFEDFGTTGLTGPIDGEGAENGGFAAFARWRGRSNKSSSSGGKFGLGKTVFTASSSVRSIFFATVREGDGPDAGPYFMGCTLIRSHRTGGVSYKSGAFFHDRLATPPESVELPFSGSPAEFLCALVDFRRRSGEPGTSIIVPHPLKGISPVSICKAVMRHFHPQILAGLLEVVVNGWNITADTLPELAATDELGDDCLRARIAASLELARPRLRLALRIGADGKPEKSPALLTVQDEMRSRRAFTVDAKFVAISGVDGSEPDIVYAFSPLPDFCGEPPADIGRPMFTRKGVSLVAPPRDSLRQGLCVAHVVSREGIRKLGLYENPAHDQWVRSYVNDADEDSEECPKTLPGHVQGLPRLLETLSRSEDDKTMDVPCMLSSFFSGMSEDEDEEQPPKSAPHAGAGKGDVPGGRNSRKGSDPSANPRLKSVIDKLSCSYEAQGTFTVTGDSLEEYVGKVVRFNLGYKINKTTHTKSIEGHKPRDFDITRKMRHAFETSGCDVRITSANQFEMLVTGPHLSLSVGGFDPNRCLSYEVRSIVRKESVIDKLSCSYEAQGTFTVTGDSLEEYVGKVVRFDLGYKINKTTHNKRIKGHKPRDLDITRKMRHAFETSGCDVRTTAPNRFEMTITGSEVSLSVGGFDPNRCLSHEAKAIHGKGDAP